MPQIESFPYPSEVQMSDFKKRALNWARLFEPVCYLDHNAYSAFGNYPYEGILAVGANQQFQGKAGNGAFDGLKEFCDQTNDWLFGYLTYDLKNEVEALSSDNPDGIGFPDLHFFQPEVIFFFQTEEVRILSHFMDVKAVWEAVLVAEPSQPLSLISGPPLARMSRDQYLETIEQIRQHIKQGDVYEMNFCQEFFLEDCQIEPLALFHRLNDLARAPFSAYYQLSGKHLLCASPERFLKKSGNQLISQPIKGTIQRGRTELEDKAFREQLAQSSKDRSENVMIVDLVRNDLARSCRPGTVQVEELFGIYGFETVYQMISTISGELRPDVHFIDAIKAAFPMGSMTGAPKVRAMELIEQHECSKRGLYSGAVGYLTPAKDFDFNVVIRSWLYNATDLYLSYQVGGAIVYDSIPEREYEECLLKAEGLLRALKGVV